MAQANKKRRRQAPTKNETPSAVLRFDPDIGVTYQKLIVRYRDCMTERSDLEDQMAMFTAMGRVEHESSNVSSEIEQLDQKMHQLKLSLLDVGGKLKTELYKAGVEADIIKRLELEDWLDHSLHKELCIRLDEWRYKREAQRDALKQETPLDQANGDGAESDRTVVNESPPLMDDPIANHCLATVAKLKPDTLSEQMQDALHEAGMACKKVKPGHGRWWTHRQLRSAYGFLPDGKLKKWLNDSGLANPIETGVNRSKPDSEK